MSIEITDVDLRRAKVNANIKLTDVNYEIRKKLFAAGSDSGLEKTVYDALKYSVGIQMFVMNQIHNKLSQANSKEFGLIFSSYISAQMGLDLIQGINGRSDAKSKGQNYFEDKHVDFQRTYPGPLEEMLSMLSSALDYPGGGIVNVVEDYFEWAMNETQLAKERGDYTKFIGEIQKEGVRVGNYTFRNFDTMALTPVSTNGQLTEWDDLGGYDYVKDHFKDITTLIKGIDHCNECKDYMPLDERLIKGTLIVGPPNTGKTKMIEIFTHQAGIPYDMFSVGNVASDYKDRRTMNIVAKFEAAARQVRQGITPVYLLYLMELDGLTKPRDSRRSNEDSNDAVTEMLIYMRGPKATPGVIVVADSNMPQMIEPAFLTAGRITRILMMGHPNQNEVEQIYLAIISSGEKYSSNSKVFGNIDYKYLAKLCNNTEYLNDTIYHDLIRRTVIGGYTGGDIRETILNAKRNKLLDHIKFGKELTPIVTEDLVRELQVYNKLRGFEK